MEKLYTLDNRMNKTPQEREAEVLKDYTENWLPLLKTDGQFDAQKIQNEFMDLLFVAAQVSEIYDKLTNGQLTKPMYYASTIIAIHEEEVMKAYDNGYEDALDEYGIDKDVNTKL